MLNERQHSTVTVTKRSFRFRPKSAVPLCAQSRRSRKLGFRRKADVGSAASLRRQRPQDRSCGGPFFDHSRNETGQRFRWLGWSLSSARVRDAGAKVHLLRLLVSQRPAQIQRQGGASPRCVFWLRRQSLFRDRIEHFGQQGLGNRARSLRPGMRIKHMHIAGV
jgi:hypothetical protein